MSGGAFSVIIASASSFATPGPLSSTAGATLAFLAAGFDVGACFGAGGLLGFGGSLVLGGLGAAALSLLPGSLSSALSSSNLSSAAIFSFSVVALRRLAEVLLCPSSVASNYLS